jgi:hypothetical protein
VKLNGYNDITNSSYSICESPIDDDSDHLADADRKSASAHFLQHSLGIVSKDAKYDWTTTDPPPNATDHILLARSVNWGATPLGHMSKWSRQLRHTANLLMATPTPAIVMW